MKSAQQRLFKEIHVWRSVDDKTLLRYRCFQELPHGKFYVKGADHLHEPYKESDSKMHDRYAFESLFYGGLLFSSKTGSTTLEGAIAKFDDEFDVHFA